MTTPPDPQQGQPPPAPAQPPAPSNGAASDDAKAHTDESPEGRQPTQPDPTAMPQVEQPTNQGQAPSHTDYPPSQYQSQPPYPAPPQYPGQPEYPPQGQYPGQPQYQGQPYPQQPYPQQPEYQGQPSYAGEPPERPPLPGEQPPPGQQGYPYPAGAANQYPYPYGQPPAGLTEAARVPVPKPPEMHISLVLLILAALLPGLVGAGLVIVSFGAQSQLNTLADQLNVASGIIGVVRSIGVVFFLLAVAYIVFAVIAYRGRNWARILVTVLTALFDVVLVLGLVGGTNQTTGGLLIGGGIVLASVIGVVLMYLPKPAAFFAAAGRR